MEYKDNLYNQIKESYGKLLYTYTAHWKLSDRCLKYDKWIKISEIILCAITATGLIGYIIADAQWLIIVGAVFSAFSLAVTLLVNEMNWQEKSVIHKNTADEYWLIRENYISLLTDFPVLSEKEIQKKRDTLLQLTDAVNRKAPPTDDLSYKEAQKALKENDEQHFTDNELDKLVPEHLRK